VDPVKLAPALGWQEPLVLLLGLGDAGVDNVALGVGVALCVEFGLLPDPQEAIMTSSSPAAGTAQTLDL
jgi:hypothetical protein